MDTPQDIFYIQADKQSNGKYIETELHNSLDSFFRNIEYGDVEEGEYQIWEYPSGKKFDVKVDRKVNDSYYYTTPTEEVWEPILNLTGEDVQQVQGAYERLVSNTKKQNILKRMLRWLIKH